MPSGYYKQFSVVNPCRCPCELELPKVYIVHHFIGKASIKTNKLFMKCPV